MGNLLGAPVTDKETHAGRIPANPDHGIDTALNYAVTSMQGWRVHMEDAHITEPTLYAIRKNNEPTATTTATTETNTTTTASNTTTTLLALPGHSLFAVFDGHGGSYAAIYAGRNLCRVLSTQDKFLEYTQQYHKHQAQSARLSVPARTQLVQLLEQALTQAFMALDAEIALALKGQPVPEADQPYPPNNNDDHKMTTTNSTLNTTTNDTSNNNDASEEKSTTNDNTNTNNKPDAINIDEEGDSGTTACVVLLTPHTILCANAGDSRSVLATKNHTSSATTTTTTSSTTSSVIPLSFDHKPDDTDEESRIRAAGGYVAGGRVEGDLAVSRGLGDFRFKNLAHVAAQTPALVASQKVSPVPDIIALERTSNTTNNNTSQQQQQHFILIACDGIFDVQTNEEAVELVNDLYKEGETDLALMCEEVADVCLQLGSKDNMTVLLVELVENTNTKQSNDNTVGVLARRQKRHEQAQAREQQHQQTTSSSTSSYA